MLNDMKIPNLATAAKTAPASREVDILRQLTSASMNESINAEPQGDSAPVVCPQCGITWNTDNTIEGVHSQICSVCGFESKPEAEIATPDAEVEPEADADLAQFESVADNYLSLLESEDYASAKALLESEGIEATAEGNDIILEKYVIKVSADGKKRKVKVKTKKTRRTPAQKAALRKARKTANKGAAKKKRKKAMKARARMGLNESIRKTQIVAAVSNLLESNEIAVDSNAIKAMVNEAYQLTEAASLLPEDKAMDAVQSVFNNYGLDVVDISAEYAEEVLVVNVVTNETEADVYLGDVADEVAKLLELDDVDYDEPETDADDNTVSIDFYFLPNAVVSESVDATIEPEEDPTDEPEEEPTNECDDKDMKESLHTEYAEMFESLAGGESNVRCKLNPAFIKAGQTILDADDGTVFTALSESVSTENGYEVAIKVDNSMNESLADLAEGASVMLDSGSSYFLLRSNPIQE